MSERRVRPVGRPQYTRPSARAARRQSNRLNLTAIPLRYILFVAILVLILFGLYKTFEINRIVVRSPSRVADIEAKANSIKQGSLRQRNLISIDIGKFESDLKQADPLILSVQLKRKWFHELQIIVNLKQPGLGWTTGNQTYLIDRDGTVIDVYPPDSNLPVVVDDSNLPVVVGKRIVSTKFVTFVTNLSDGISTIGLKTTKYEVKETTVDLYVSTDRNYQLIFDTTRNPADELLDLKGVLDTLAKQKKIPSSYIDLRIPNKAYYK